MIRRNGYGETIHNPAAYDRAVRENSYRGFLEKGQFELDPNNKYDMEARAVANQLWLRGDVKGAMGFLTLHKAIRIINYKPVKVEMITFNKKGKIKEVPKNCKAVINALIKSGWSGPSILT